MTRHKTTKAVYKTVRLNPTTSDYDARILEIIHSWEERGYDFKKSVSDAILRSEGFTPEMFSRSAPVDWMGYIEETLTRFQQELLTEIRKRGHVVEDEPEGNEESVFTKNFAKKFMERQNRAVGDEK